MADDGSSPESDLCLACGMCCDGTLFTHAEVNQRERGDIAPLGIACTEEEGKFSFALPCPAHDAARGCTIYRHRPSTCQTFACKTLREMEDGEIPRSEAHRRVEAALAAAGRLKERLEPGESIADARRTWHTLDPQAMLANAGVAERHFRYVALNLLLDRHFRIGGQKHIRFGMGED